MLNQVILVGKATDIFREKGIIVSLRIVTKRVGNSLIEDRPKIFMNEGLGETIGKSIKEGDTIGVKARIETETKGRYGTVSKVVAEKVTFITTKANE